MTERSPFLSAGWGRYQTRGLSFANYDGSSLPREPMGWARIGPIWGMPEYHSSMTLEERCYNEANGHGSEEVAECQRRFQYEKGEKKCISALF